MTNPYTGLYFFSFIYQFLERFFHLLQGKLTVENLAADEIQLLTLICLSVAASFLGCFLFLKKMTMLANALSHTLLLGIILSFIWTNSFNPTYLAIASLGTSFLTTYLTNTLKQRARLQEDASIGLSFTSLFALGILAASLLTRNVHIGQESVMGNVDALHRTDLLWMFYTMIGSVCLLILFFRGIVISTFDPLQATLLGFTPYIFEQLLLSLCSLVAISSFKAVGVLMFLAFLTGPPLTARLLTSKLRPFLFLSILTGILAALCGCALSRHLLTTKHLPLSTSGLTTCVIGFFFLLATFIYSSKKNQF